MRLDHYTDLDEKFENNQNNSIAIFIGRMLMFITILYMISHINYEFIYYIN